MMRILFIWLNFFSAILLLPGCDNRENSRPSNYDSQETSKPSNYDNQGKSMQAAYDNQKDSQPSNYDNQKNSKQSDLGTQLIQSDLDWSDLKEVIVTFGIPWEINLYYRFKDSLIPELAAAMKEYTVPFAGYSQMMVQESLTIIYTINTKGDPDKKFSIHLHYVTGISDLYDVDGVKDRLLMASQRVNECFFQEWVKTKGEQISEEQVKKDYPPILDHEIILLNKWRTWR